MELIKITDLAPQLGLTSRSLRYYEEAGLIQSVRLPGEKYRFFDAANIERLKQIIVLRKMMIPIKDILRIYHSSDMSVVVEVFVGRIRQIDQEALALSELRRITDEFLKTMQKNGVKKISALPLLYEALINQELDQGDAEAEDRLSVSYEALSAVSAQLVKPVEPSIVRLPVMRVLSSRLKESPQASDTDGFWRWVQMRGLSPGHPGAHERFEFQSGADDVTMLKVADDFVNDGPYWDYPFEGGLFAAVSTYLDEDLGERFRALVSSFDNNPYYEIDYRHDGRLRHEVMLENLISPDEKRALVSLLAPVKKRLADPALFDRPVELSSDAITIEEIEKANPILWEVDVPLDKLTPINNPHYRVLDSGEVEYTGWISTRVLSTNVSVKLPFRVDIAYRIAGDDERFGYGDSEGSMIFYHGDDTGYFAGGGLGQMGFGVNMGNQATSDAWVTAPTRQEALSFRQPVFRDLYSFPGRGRIKPGEYNQITWIVGEKHLAAIINGEMRYCGTDFPYMALDLSHEEARPIVVGSNGQGMKYFRSIRVSQLAQTQKNKMKRGELFMITRQSNNTIPNLHRLITDEYGENYWFNGCAKYVMESLGEKDFDYQFFAGVTGDMFTQYYPLDHFRGEGVSGYLWLEDAKRFVEALFAKCGYAATYVPEKELQKNTQMYLQTLLSYIDKGIPVIVWGHGGPPVGVYVGYEDYGKALLYVTGNNNQPERMTLEKALTADADRGGGWVFVGEKKEDRPLAQIYREAIFDLPRLLTMKTETFCFGAEAFRTWANDIESGKLGEMTLETEDYWALYTSYICGMATNGSCCHGFLQRAQELNPDMDFIEEIGKRYKRTAEIWNNDNGEDLEALGGGFNVTLEVLQDENKRAKIAAKIREAAQCVDQVVEILKDHLPR